MITKTEPVTTTETMERYLSHLQKLNLYIANHPQALEKLFTYIEEQKSAVDLSQEENSFFMGEQAFYKNDYEQSLVHYMKARTVPYFEFFSIRASAHISFERGDLEKAKHFIGRALEIRPSDFPTLLLQLEICKNIHQQDEAKEIERKIDALKKSGHLPESGAANPVKPTEAPSTRELIAHQLGVDSDAERALEQCIQQFQQREKELVHNYIKEFKEKKPIQDRVLYILDSWTKKQSSPSANHHPLLAEHSRQNSGGFFIRWNGRGIAVNPGPHFLENFHSQGLHIQDIHDVIVTKEHLRAYTDVTRIYDLNYRLNQVNPELHVINYYLNHKAYQTLSHLLTPNFKQERNTVHSLELFIDSPDVEKQELAEGVTLNFFSISSKSHVFGKADFKEKNQETSALGIRFDLTMQEEDKEMASRRIGYISGAPWSPLLAHHLGRCDILIAGFGETEANDYGKLHYHSNSLGYYGTYTLLEEIKPRLLLCVEFEGREGDIRLEVGKKLRKEYGKSSPSSDQQPIILPAGHGFSLNLQSFQVGCSVSQHLLDLGEVHVVKTGEPFDHLRYLSVKSIL
ncbi:MAG: hypothetical protein WB791_08880 [Waddliaceae bacterium]